MSSSTLQSIVESVRGWVEDKEVVGAEILILKNRKIVLHEAVGMMDVEDGQPMRKDTICCIRSMSKPVVGTAIQMLVDEGKLDLDDRASKHLPSFDNDKSREITVRQLLTHTAGFPLTVMNRPHTTYSGQREVADQAGSVGPSRKPGAGFSYSDSDTETLAAIVSQISGKPVDLFIEERILTPLGMRDTYCVLRDDAPNRARVSSNYAGQTGLWHKYWDNDEARFFPYFLGAAAMYSTPQDYARFVAMWADRGRVGSTRLLSDAAVERSIRPAVAMLAPALDLELKIDQPTGFPDTRVFYGLHWMVYQGKKEPAPGVIPNFGHEGSDGTGAWDFPEQDLMAFYFTQSRNGLTVFRFEELLAPLVGLPAPAPKVSTYGGKRLTVEEMKPYLGVYQDQEAKKGALAYVTMWGNRLAIELPGSGASALRWPDAEGRWGFESPSSGVRFRKDDRGQISGLVLLEEKLEIPFVRVQSQEGLPTVDHLMAERRRLQGGDRISELQRLRTVGSLDIGAAKGVGQMEILLDGGDRLVRRVSVQGKLIETTIVDRGHAWQSTPGKPAQELKGLFLEQAILTNPLLRLDDWRTSHETVEVVCESQVGAEDVWVVRTKPKSLPASTKYVSIQTGLLLKEDAWITAKGIGTVPISIEFEDYRDVGGVLLPFRVSSKSAVTGRQVGHFTEAEANPKFPDDAFTIPKGAQ